MTEAMIAWLEEFRHHDTTILESLHQFTEEFGLSPEEAIDVITEWLWRQI